MLATCFDAHCAILRENSYYFSIPSAFCEVVTMVEFQSVEYNICGGFQCCWQLLKQCWVVMVWQYFFHIKNLCLKLHNKLKCSWQDGGSTSLCLVSLSFLSTKPLFTLLLLCWLPFVSSYWLLSPCASGGLCYLVSLISRFSLFLVMFFFLKFLNHFNP